MLRWVVVAEVVGPFAAGWLTIWIDHMLLEASVASHLRRQPWMGVFGIGSIVVALAVLCVAAVFVRYGVRRAIINSVLDRVTSNRLCASCGYALPDQGREVVCPECGRRDVDPAVLA